MIAVTSNQLAQAFLQEELGVLPAADFRGALFAPEHVRNALITKESAAVVVGWHGFTGRTCNISIVVQKPEYLTRWVIREIFRFPFEICGLSAVIATVDSNNHKSIELCRRSGFELMCVIESGGDTGDLLCFVMHKSKCRWLRKVH